MEAQLIKDLLSFRSRLDELKAKGLISSYDEDPEALDDGVYVFSVSALWDDTNRYTELSRVISEQVFSRPHENLILFYLEPARR